MAYPTATELQNFLKGAGLITDPSASPDSLIDYTGAVNAAQAEWEALVKWFPFVSSGSATTRYFDHPLPNGRDYPLLDLAGGLTSITSVVVSGATLVENTDFGALPENASAQGLPVKQLEFYRSYYSSTPRCVAVTGKWGRCDTLPADVKSAVLAGAAAVVMAQCALKVSGGGLTEWREGDESQKFSAADYTRYGDAYRKQFTDAAEYYRRR